MVKNSAEIIQAFPIKANTYTGTPSGFNASGYEILHVVADCDITFDFGVGGMVVLSAISGQDLAFGTGVQTITATAEVWIS